MRRLLDADIPEKRRRGRVNIRWKDACKRDTKEAGLRGQRNKQGSMEE